MNTSSKTRPQPSPPEVDRIRDNLTTGDALAAAARWRTAPPAAIRGRNALFFDLLIALAETGATGEIDQTARHTVKHAPAMINFRLTENLVKAGRPIAAALLARAALQRRSKREPEEIIHFARLALRSRLAPSLGHALGWFRPSDMPQDQWLFQWAREARWLKDPTTEFDLLTACTTVTADTQLFRQARLLRLTALEQVNAEQARAERAEIAVSPADTLYLRMQLAANQVDRPDLGYRRLAEHIVLSDAPGDACLVFASGFHKETLLNLFEPVLIRLAEMGVAHATIGERGRTLLLNGFGPWAGSMTDAARGLTDLLARHGKTRIATVGNSGGGLGALLYGAMMPADGVLTFSGVSYLPDPDNLVSVRALSPLKRVLKQVPPGDYNARARLLASPGTKCHCYYPEHSPFDADQAANIADLPNVTAFPEDSAEHGLIGLLGDQDRLSGLLLDFLADLGWIPAGTT